VIWCSAEFGFVRLSDAWTTGSSIMPQKRNPDAAELVRAKAGRIIGGLNTLMVVMKGLPMAYGKDMQEDKEAVFLAADALMLSLAAMTGMAADLQPDAEAMRRALERGFPTATDLADWLVRDLGMPFRDAHHVTGRIVALASEQGCGLADLPLDAMQAVEPRITKAIYPVLAVDSAIDSRASQGGTAPKRVREAAKAARKRFL
jgi:argininosuccinate lyase